MAAELVILNEKQVRDLASVIRYQEADCIQKLRFSTEAERVQYLYDSMHSYDSLINFLDVAVELKDMYKDDQDLGPIGEDFYTYLVSCANCALQTFPNYQIRLKYVQKINEHTKTIKDGFKEHKTSTSSGLVGLKEAMQGYADLAEEAIGLKNSMQEYLKQYRSSASQSFSQWIKDKRVSYSQLVQKYMGELGYSGPFKELSEGKQLDVHNKIVEASGRGKVIKVSDKLIHPEGTVSKVKRVAAGNAGLLYTAYNMTFDIYTAENKVQVAARDVVSTVAAEVGGVLIDQVVAAAVRTSVGMILVEAGVVAVVGAVASFAGAFIIGIAAGMLFDMFFFSGGDAPLSTAGLKCYVAVLPDPIVLARQIAHA